MVGKEESGGKEGDFIDASEGSICSEVGVGALGKVKYSELGRDEEL